MCEIVVVLIFLASELMIRTRCEVRICTLLSDATKFQTRKDDRRLRSRFIFSSRYARCLAAMISLDAEAEVPALFLLLEHCCVPQNSWIARTPLADVARAQRSIYVRISGLCSSQTRVATAFIIRSMCVRSQSARLIRHDADATAGRNCRYIYIS